MTKRFDGPIIPSSVYDAEIAQNRPEYQEHKAALEEFRRQASQTP